MDDLIIYRYPELRVFVRNVEAQDEREDIRPRDGEGNLIRTNVYVEWFMSFVCLVILSIWMWLGYRFQMRQQWIQEPVLQINDQWFNFTDNFR